MRIRTVKPEFWQDEDLAEISETARLVAIGLLNMADDEGFFNANEKLVSSLLFPLTEPSVSIHECLNQLVQSGYLKLYPCKKGKKVYGQVVNFLKHQKVNRPSHSKIKDLMQFNDNSLNNHGSITVGKEQGTGNREQGKELGRELGREAGSLQSHELLLSESKTKHSDAKAPNTISTQVNEVFEYWKATMNKNESSKLTKERDKKVRERLKDGYTVDQIKLAVFGCSQSPHNMGQNENRKVYDDLELICRTGSNLERFAGYSQPVPMQEFSSVTAGNIEMMRDWTPDGGDL